MELTNTSETPSLLNIYYAFPSDLLRGPTFSFNDAKGYPLVLGAQIDIASFAEVEVCLYFEMTVATYVIATKLLTTVETFDLDTNVLASSAAFPYTFRPKFIVKTGAFAGQNGNFSANTTNTFTMPTMGNQLMPGDVVVVALVIARQLENSGSDPDGASQRMYWPELPATALWNVEFGVWTSSLDDPGDLETYIGCSYAGILQTDVNGFHATKAGMPYIGPGQTYLHYYLTQTYSGVSEGIMSGAPAVGDNPCDATISGEKTWNLDGTPTATLPNIVLNANVAGAGDFSYTGPFNVITGAWQIYPITGAIFQIVFSPNATQYDTDGNMSGGAGSMAYTENSSTLHIHYSDEDTDADALARATPEPISDYEDPVSLSYFTSRTGSPNFNENKLFAQSGTISLVLHGLTVGSNYHYFVEMKQATTLTPYEADFVAESVTQTIEVFDFLSQPDPGSVSVVSPSVIKNGAIYLATNPVSVPSAQEGVPYSFAFSASGGTAPYEWLTDSDGIPPGLTLSPSGVLSGTPGALSPGTYFFAVKVLDSDTETARGEFEKTFVLVVALP